MYENKDVNFMEIIKLVGILIIVIGFLMKFDTIAIVVIAGIATAFVSQMSPTEFLSELGTAFVDNRLVTLFFLTLPMIGLSESHGLKDQAIKLIHKVKGITAGKFLSIYLFIRELAGFFSIRLGGHPQFVRPLVLPMTEAAARSTNGEVDEKALEEIKARSAAMENYGNFFGQNTFVGAGGVLLIVGTLESLGYDATPLGIAKASIVVALIMLALGIISNYLFDRKLKSYVKKDKEKGA